MNLQEVTRFRVNHDVLQTSQNAIEEAGEDGYELFVLWSGVFENTSAFRVLTSHIPEQRSYKTPDGLLVKVDGEALHRLNTTLFNSGETLAAQVHAHPTNAFHSTTDSTYPIVTTLGGLSVVAPDFATRGIFTNGTAAYRLTASGWSRIRSRRIKNSIEIVSS